MALTGCQVANRMIRPGQAIGSFWGFLETFELVPHVPGWWAVPIWALGMGLGQAWQSLGQNRGIEE